MTIPDELPQAVAVDDFRERADRHADEAEHLLKSWFLSSHVKGQLHATLALYYLTKDAARVDSRSELAPQR
jgi:hypothetical protein